MPESWAWLLTCPKHECGGASVAYVRPVTARCSCRGNYVVTKMSRTAAETQYRKLMRQAGRR